MSERLRRSIRQKLRPSIFTVSIQNKHLQICLLRKYKLPKVSFVLFQKSSECSDCMLVEIGEKTSYFGEPCEKCGRYPRTPYHVNYWDCQVQMMMIGREWQKSAKECSTVELVALHRSLLFASFSPIFLLTILMSNKLLLDVA